MEVLENLLVMLVIKEDQVVDPVLQEELIWQQEKVINPQQ